MKIVPRLISVAACASLLAGAAQALQTVQFANVTRNGSTVTGPVFAGAGDVVGFDAVLTANGDTSTLGLGLCLLYQRAAAGDPVIRNLLSTGLVARGTPAPVSGCNDGGALPVPGADFMVIDGWAVFSGGGWPGVPVPVKLYDVQFTLPATPPGATRVGFGASAAATGQAFSTNGALALCGKPTARVEGGGAGFEVGPTPMNFTVVLSSAVPPECGNGGVFPVSLTLAGTATVPGGANADYTITGAGVTNTGASVTVAFPADGATTRMTVTAVPINDGQTEGTETVTLTVAGGSGNYAGLGNQATATIDDGSAVRVIVVEYQDTVDFPNAPGGHFFYSSDPAEQAAVDAGAAGQFHRTARQFATGGSSPVCRFYGSQTPGPNSHFFTVNAAECQGLKSSQIVPTPSTVQQWNYEGIAYAATPPVVGANNVPACPAGTLPIYRAYNNAFPLAGPRNPWDSNHRFTPLQTDIVTMVSLGWRDEGIAFCTTP